MVYKKNNFWNVTVIYSIGFLGLRAISFLLLPLYTNLLSANEAGYIFILYTIIAFLNTLYSHGMDSSLLKYYQENNSQKIITTSLLYSILWGILLSLVLYFLHQPLKYFNVVSIYSSQHIALLVIGILFSDMISSRLMTVIRLLEKPIYFLVVSFANVLLSIFLNIYFVKELNMGFNGALLALLCVSIIQLVLLLPLLIFNLRLYKFDFVLLKKMLHFSIPFLPASIFFIMIEMSDRLMLGWLSSVEDVGLYGTGYKVGAIILLIVRAFNLNWQPFYLKSDNGVEQFEKIGSRFIVFLIFISTIITMIWPLLFKIKINNIYLIGETFWMGGVIIPIIAFSYVLYGLFILQMPSIYIKNKHTWVPYFWGFGFIVNFVSNYLLIPIYGFYGAAYSTLFAYLSMASFLLYKNQTWLQIKYNLKDILYISTVSGLALIGVCCFELVLILIIYFMVGTFKIYKMQQA